MPCWPLLAPLVFQQPCLVRCGNSQSMDPLRDHLLAVLSVTRAVLHGKHDLSLRQGPCQTYPHIGVSCRKLTEQLALVGAYEEQSACRQWAEDIQPAVRFCQYQLDRKGPPPTAAEPLFPEQGLSQQAAQVRFISGSCDLVALCEDSGSRLTDVLKHLA